MSEVEFHYKGETIIIQCNENENLREIIERFCSQAHIDRENICLLYNGISGIEFNEELTFIQMVNNDDRERNRMSILVNDNDEKRFIKSKNVICPICGEKIKIKINNYKISLFDCKNGHKINNLSFNEYEN